LQAASTFFLNALGLAEASATSTHTSFAAARAATPLDALLQVPSALVFTCIDSAGSPWMNDLQIATYCASAAPVDALWQTPSTLAFLPVEGLSPLRLIE
jgi:hypothetical protein